MLLEVKNVSYRYSKNSKWILKDVSFTVDSKERVALVGPSGYGKSTLSKIISGYIKPDKGEVLWALSGTHFIPKRCVSRPTLWRLCRPLNRGGIR